MIRYITRRPLWFNILVAIAIIVILFLIFMFSLNWITKHGEAKTVPAVIGKNINDVERMLSDNGFETVIQDSVFYDSVPPGIVIKQVPEADQVVKVNRTVYVVINRFVAPDIPLPALTTMTYRNAEMVLKNLGLVVGDTVHRTDFAKGTILEFSFAGRPLKPGDKVKMGSRIDMVVSGGRGSEDMSVPNLVGMRLGEARILLEANGLILGPTIPVGNVQDYENAFIVRQSPMSRTADGAPVRIFAGQMVDVWISVNPPVTDTTNSNQPRPADDQY